MQSEAEDQHDGEPSSLLAGAFQHNESPLTLRFASGKRHKVLGVMMLPAGSNRAGSGWWWRAVSYEFDSSWRDQYMGRMILGAGGMFQNPFKWQHAVVMARTGCGATVGSLGMPLKSFAS